MADLQTNQHIDELRTNLSDKLAELQRRANAVTATLSPLRYWRHPLVRVAIGAVVGFAVADPRRSGTLLRLGVTIATSALVAHAVASGARR